MKNGDLLEAAETAGYEVLLTVDQGMPPQQPSSNRKLSIIVLCTQTNTIEELLSLADVIARALKGIKPGQVVPIP